MTRRSQPNTGVPEKAMTELWLRTTALPGGLTASDGRHFEVIYPGRPSAAAGPDFRDAILQTGSGERIRGDVELHVDASGWRGHGHHADPNYNGVVLNVVLHPKTPIPTVPSQSGIPVPVVELDTQRLPGPVQPAPEDMEDLGRLLDEAGDARFAARSDGFAAEMKTEEPEEVLWRGLLEALGYSANRKSFLALARLVPFTSLYRFRAEPATTRLLALKATLLGAAGLLASAPAGERAELETVRRLLPAQRSLARDAWHTFRVRPSNHPGRRVLGAACLAARCVDEGLLDVLESLVRGGDVGAVRGGLAVEGFVGTGRAGDMAVNVVLPFFHALGAARRDGRLAGPARALYVAWPAQADNEVTREALRLLGGDGSAARTARRQQGLIAVYKRRVSGRVA
ncbi:MAG: DUF2851 family protein [SAR202 cluster bacterium]|nr:DUF2851 family protein [SAR202 cluster bacterium]